MYLDINYKRYMQLSAHVSSDMSQQKSVKGELSAARREDAIRVQTVLFDPTAGKAIFRFFLYISLHHCP